MPVYLQAIAAQFYRGIGPETQYITGFSDMNFFIGPNNAGKSVVLNLIHDRLPFGKKAKPAQSNQNSTENYRGAQSGQFLVAIGVPAGNALQNGIKTENGSVMNSVIYSGVLQKLNKDLTLNDNVWITGNEINDCSFANAPDIDHAKSWLHRDHWFQLWLHFTDFEGGGSLSDWVTDSLRAFARRQTPAFPQTLMIPAKRKLGPKDETFDDQSGKGLINHLAAMQNPDHHEQDKRQTFDQINEFVRAVTGKPNAQLNVPDNKEHLLIHMDNKVLPLESLGTGIHEVILIAAFCTIHQQKIMCIEEPEIHLHPILQRKLIRYLQEKTENQYFIATHSAAFIDTPGASVYRVHNDGVQTRVSPALLRGERRQICNDLGYKASDIMQANAVIWVEGPSDRIYLKHWISAVDRTLIEGEHYSILFYGGSLIKHLSADEDAVADFIKLRELNRNFAVVLDSDKEKAQSPLKRAARRIEEELKTGDGIAWITKGREVENYVPPAALQAALQAIHPDIYSAPDAVGPYDHAFYFKRKKADKTGGLIHKSADKVSVASKVCETGADLSILDLKLRITALVAMIKQANEP